MAWIKTDQALKDHRKLLDAAYQLKIPPPHMMGLLISLWLWCLDNAPDGNLTGVPAWVISRAAQWDDDPGKFVEILTKTGWIDDKEGVFVHDWDDYAGDLLRKRNDEKARAKANRIKAKEEMEKRTAYVQRTSDIRPADVRSKSRVEKSRVEKSNIPPISPQGDCAEPEKSDSPPEPPVVTLLLKTGEGWPVTAQQAREWQDSFPGVNVMYQLQKMERWCEDNPTKRKTKVGIRKFAVNWLTSEQDEIERRKNSKPDPAERHETYKRTSDWEGLTIV